MAYFMYSTWFSVLEKPMEFFLTGTERYFQYKTFSNRQIISDIDWKIYRILLRVDTNIITWQLLNLFIKSLAI